MGIEILGIGLTGKSLTDLEREILRERSPCAIVLFGRNIDSPGQLRDLIAEVKSLPKRAPLIMIDQEGGRVDRLRQIVPGLPSAEAFGERDDPVRFATWFGRVTGLALRWFDIEVNLAPVVDVRRDPAPKGLERRAFGRDPGTVIELAGAFMRGQHESGVACCLKHWPGIGAGSADPHYGATVIDVPSSELHEIDLPPFARLGNEAGAIMIGHGTYPRIESNADLPATLSYRMTTDLLRNDLGFDGAAVSDDMEMHAVSDLGSYEEIAESALLAGNDVILFCSHIERMPAVDRYLASRASEDAAIGARYREALQRIERYREHCERIRAAAPVAASFDEVLEEAGRFAEAFEAMRRGDAPPDGEGERRVRARTPGKGRTGREEWT